MAARPLSDLTPREQQVAQLEAAGKSVGETADALGISRATVNKHRDKISNRLATQPRLSRRQRQVVSCLALGLTVHETADVLGVAAKTAVQHRSMAGLSLGIRSVVGLTHYAIVEGWVQAGDALSPDRIVGALAKIERDARRPRDR